MVKRWRATQGPVTFSLEGVVRGLTPSTKVLGRGPFTRKELRVPVLRRSLLRRVDKAVGLHETLSRF